MNAAEECGDITELLLCYLQHLNCVVYGCGYCCNANEVGVGVAKVFANLVEGVEF
jgi:hypothetical protein